MADVLILRRYPGRRFIGNFQRPLANKSMFYFENQNKYRNLYLLCYPVPLSWNFCGDHWLKPPAPLRNLYLRSKIFRISALQPSVSPPHWAEGFAPKRFERTWNVFQVVTKRETKRGKRSPEWVRNSCKNRCTCGISSINRDPQARRPDLCWGNAPKIERLEAKKNCSKAKKKQRKWEPQTYLTL